MMNTTEVRFNSATDGLKLDSDQFWEVLRARVKACYGSSMANADLDITIDNRGQIAGMTIEGGEMPCERCNRDCAASELRQRDQRVLCVGCDEQACDAADREAKAATPTGS